MIENRYICDQCGAIKGSTNHWWRVRIGQALHIYPWDLKAEGYDDDSIQIRHVCGQQCLFKLVQLSLDSLSSTSTIPSANWVNEYA